MRLLRITSFLVLSLSGVSPIMAQTYKFGKISKEELLETAYSLDSTANAAVLYEHKNVAVVHSDVKGFQLITEVHKRIKLYNKDGFEHASETLLLYKQGADEELVTTLKGATYTLVDGKIKATKLKKEGIFKNEFSENYNQHKFTMPALTEGAIIEYKYKIKSPFLGVIDRIYLQYEIPVKRMEVRVNTPEYYRYKKFSTGYLPINLKEFQVKDKLTYKTETRMDVETPGGQMVKGKSYDLDFMAQINEVVAVEVPAFKKEPYSGNIENYISSLMYELSSIQYPSEPIKNRATTWEAVTKTIYESSSFGKELKKEAYYKDDIDQLLTGVSNPQTKVQLIYDFVKKKMTWNKKSKVFTTLGVKKAYKEGVGNAAEINLMLTSMLNYAKIEANPVLASTSNRLWPLFPTLNGFNYVLTRIKMPNGAIGYLDATDKYGMINILPDRVVRGMGRVIAKNGTSQSVDFRPVKPSMDRCSINCKVTADGVLEGTASMRHTSYLAHHFRVKNASLDAESKLNKIKKKYGLTNITDYKVKGIKTFGEGVSEVFTFNEEDQVEAIEDEIFFSPLLFLRNKENVFKSDDRKYPVDFGYGFANMYMITIQIPEGYKVQEAPENKAFRLPENMGKFSYLLRTSGNTIQVVVNETINKSVIGAENYLTLKEFYNQIIQKEEEQIILKKI